MVARGDTFVHQRPVDSTEHLWVIASDLTAEQKVICVSFTSYKGNSMVDDLTCEIQNGEHRWVTQPTLVYYADAQYWPAQQIDKALKKGKPTRPHDPCTATLLGRITAGFELSIHTAPIYVRILREQGHLT